MPMLPMQLSFRRLLSERSASSDWFCLSVNVNVCMFISAYIDSIIRSFARFLNGIVSLGSAQQKKRPTFRSPALPNIKTGSLKRSLPLHEHILLDDQIESILNLVHIRIGDVARCQMVKRG